MAYEVTIESNGAKEILNCGTWDEVDNLCSKTFDGNGRLGTVWGSIDSGILKARNYVQVDPWTSVRVKKNP